MTIPPAQAAGAPPKDRTHASWLVPLAGAAGIALLAWLVIELGPARIASQLKGLGAILPTVMALTATKYPLQAAGWRLALPPDARPSWRDSITATITGDALGYLTWAGPFTGEPMRAMLTRDRVPVAAGIAAGAIERAVYNATAAILVWVVLVSVFATGHPLALTAGLSATAVAIVWAVRRLRRDQPAQGGEGTGATPAQGRTPGGGRAVLHAVRQLWRERRGVLPSIALLCVAQHVVLVTEAYVMLGVLGDGVTLRTALVFEAVTKIVNTVGIVVPGRIGIAEGGSALLADALGFTASYGLSLALMRRVRAIIWAGIGLGFLPFQEARARRAR